MNKIELGNLQLKVFTEQDALDYCQINDINFNNIINLNLNCNSLTDISGVKLFKNIKYLNIGDNKLTDIFIIKNLKNLKLLNINENKIKDISVIKYLTELEFLGLGNNEIKDISVIQYLNNLRVLNITNLELESDQIKYINSLKDLKTLWCFRGFKENTSLNQLNKDIKLII